MREAQAYLNALRLGVPHLEGELYGELWSLETAAYVAIIVVYSRPFRKSRSNGQAATRLDASEIGLFLDRPELAELHDQILASRDQAVAHADWDRHTTELIPSQDETIRRSSTIPRYTAHMDLKLLDDLLHHVAYRTSKMSMEIDEAHLVATGKRCK